MVGVESDIIGTWNQYASNHADELHNKATNDPIVPGVSFYEIPAAIQKYAFMTCIQ